MRVCFLLLPGLGDAITVAPLLREVARQRPSWHADALVMFSAVADYASNLGYLENVTMLPLLEMKPVAAAKALLKMRSSYDIVVVPFPAPRWHYHAIARLLSKKIVVSHEYPDPYAKIARLVLPSGIPIVGAHSVDENLNLLPSLGLQRPAGPLAYVQIEDWKSQGRGDAIAIHTGTMRYKGNEVRRWPLQRFAEVIALLHERGRRVRVVRGPHEHEDVETLRSLLPPNSFDVIEGPLPMVARAISECGLLVSNDSGIAHVAASVGTKGIVLYGMTKPKRTLPSGAVAVRPSSCPPCFDHTSRAFTCVRALDFRCIRVDLRVEDVMNAIAQAEAT